MIVSNCIVIDSNEAVDILKNLDLEPETLREIVSKGQMARNSVTPNHPLTAAGTFVYHETVRAKRDTLLQREWTKQSVSNCELTAHPHKNMTISVSVGDNETGNKLGNPKTKNQKGSQVELLINGNGIQEDMFTPSKNQATPDIKDIECQNWILLYHHDRQKDEVRLELSLPMSIGLNNKIDDWHYRIILDPIPLGTAHIENYEPDYALETDITVERISNNE